MKKILIIEDETFYADLLKFRLSDHFDVDVLNSPDGFFELYEIGKYDLLLIDINLSDDETNGIFLSRKIREIDQVVKIIILTRYDYKFHIKDAFKIPVNGYLIKTDPVSTDYFITTINKVLSGETTFSNRVAQILASSSEEEPLNRSQLNIINLLKQNIPVKQIADIRHTKLCTVRNQIQKIYKHYKVNSMQELMNVLYNN